MMMIEHNDKTYRYLRTDEGFAIERIYVNVEDANDTIVVSAGLSSTWGS